MRLYVSSSNFPRFDRNDNTGEPSASANRMLKAAQTIFRDRARPSALVLPIASIPHAIRGHVGLFGGGAAAQ